MEEQFDMYPTDNYESKEIDYPQVVRRSRTGTIKTKDLSPEQAIEYAAHKRRKRFRNCLGYFIVSLLIAGGIVIPVAVSILKRPPIYRVTHRITSKPITRPVRTPSTTNIMMTTTSFDHCERKFVALKKLDGSDVTLVATADFNNDNKTDIIYINENTEGFFIIFNLGYEKFNDAISYPITNVPLSMAIADLNGDDKLDVILGVRGYDDLSVNIYLNIGDGKFNEMANSNLNNTGQADSLIVADLDDNGRYDIIIANQEANNIGVFLNIGDNTFSEIDIYPVSIHPMSITTADLNDDTKLDIIVASAHSNEIRILFNNGNGKFSDSTSFLVRTGPLIVTSADMNNDDKSDIIVLNYFSSNVLIYYSNGRGNFTKQTNISGLANPLSIVLNDFNNDSYIDIIVPNSHSNDVVVFFNDKNGTFSTSTHYITYPLPRAVAIGDMNDDEKPDIVVGNGQYVGIVLSRCY